MENENLEERISTIYFDEGECAYVLGVKFVQAFILPNGDEIKTDNE